MLFVVSQIGTVRYAMEAAQIVEVLPALDIAPVPSAKAPLVGVCNYHGDPVPVVDLCLLATSHAAPDLLSTRLLLVRDRRDPESRLLALLAPGVTDTVMRDPGEFVASGVAGADWLGPVAPDGGGFLQQILTRALIATFGTQSPTRMAVAGANA